MVSKKKLCLLIPSLRSGGMERVMSELAVYFAGLPGLSVHIVLFGRQPVIYYPLDDQITLHLPGAEFGKRFRLWHTLKRMMYLRKTIRGIKPYSILSFGEYWNSFVLISLLGMKRNIYISDRCSPAYRFSLRHSLLRRMLYPGANGYIAQTETARTYYLREFGKGNVSVINNPIRFFPANSTPAKKTVLSVGRLIGTKNYDRLIRMFCRINKPGWSLVIVGGDALRQNNLERLKELIFSLGADKKVFLEGEKSDIASYYHKASIFAFTSESEGFPNVIGEALSAGVPVISYDCIAGPADMIIDGVNGFLVPLHHEKLFMEKLDKLMSDDTIRAKMSSEAPSSVSKLAVDEIGKAYREFILQ